MEGFVQNITVNTPQIMLHDEGYFVFRFDSMADCEAILQDGPYYFNNKTLILQRWELNFEFNPDCITTIPLWVTFPGLLIGYWSSEARSKVKRVLLGNLSIQIEFWQDVEYDWRPRHCVECIKFRHTSKKCWNKVKNSEKGKEYQEVRKNVEKRMVNKQGQPPT
ncbi:hypothetical protein H5410_000852 [Solanum commersonii]|uniref:DUF4283 domain-containing protein n=1 Tax=Solanum commersonii TaxID=4109 RepID=A0A9J6AYF5_SOLCO|nr:hypothetical protein H5410_000852 [Solanum commersonii]